MMSNSNYYRPFEKPLQHLGIDDWRSRTNHLCNLASAQRTNAFDLIQASRSIRNENHVQSQFNTTNNTIRLANRLSLFHSFIQSQSLSLSHIFFFFIRLLLYTIQCFAYDFFSSIFFLIFWNLN